MTVLIATLSAVVAILVVLVVGLLRSHAEILQVLHSLGFGEDGASATGGISLTAGRSRRSQEIQASDIDGISPDGGAVLTSVAGASHPSLLAFLSTGCATCRNFWQEFSKGPEVRQIEGANLIIVTKGPENESISALAEMAPPEVTTIMSDEAWSDYQVAVAPYFIWVDGNSSTIVGEGTATSWEQLSELIQRATSDYRYRLRPPRRRSTAIRSQDTDQALLDAGISPGDSRLFHQGGEQ